MLRNTEPTINAELANSHSNHRRIAAEDLCALS